MSKSPLPMVISIDLAEMRAGVTVTPQEAAEINHQNQIQGQAEEAKQAVVRQMMLRAATQAQQNPERN